MGDPRGFVTIRRADPKRLPVAERTKNWQEFYEPVSDDTLRAQGARCMDCGVPFCQGDTGCPVLNVIPEWNDLVYQGRWQDALKSLHATNNFPEFTGRLCPAPCESACVLGIIDKPVAIRNIEQAIADRGFAERWIVPVRPAHETGKRVAVVGSGPAGLAAAQQLRRMGHQVVVFEKADRIGGLLRYGIPDFKMEKSVLDQRLEQMTQEGVVFKTSVEVGVDLPVEKLRAEFDAVLLAGGAMQPRDLPVPGRELKGVHFAMDYLTQQNKRGAGDKVKPAEVMDAKGKAVIVIGGGDTGSDCIGTCHRQGATVVHQLEILPQPPDQRDSSTPWPYWPMQLRSSHAHEEGADRQWSVLTTKLSGENGAVKKLHAVRVELKTEGGRSRFQEIPGSAFTIDAEIVLLAMGFTGTSKDRLYGNLGIELDARGNVPTDANYMTPVDGVFAAGDTKRGASLIVWAIREGRDAAREINRYLAEGRVGKTTSRPTHLRMVNA